MTVARPAVAVSHEASSGDHLAADRASAYRDDRDNILPTRLSKGHFHGTLDMECDALCWKVHGIRPDRDNREWSTAEGVPLLIIMR